VLSTVEVAQRVGVSKNTLLRWLDEGLVEDVERDWRGWRIWRAEDIARIRVFREAYHSEPLPRVRRRRVPRAADAKAVAASMAHFGRGYCRRPEEAR